MPPKSKASAADKNKDLQETEDPLQAVVLTDSFETRFAPFTLEKPRCLLPLANTPLIEYTLEFLAGAGVDEVYIYCGAHTDLIEQYISQSKWTSPSSPFRVKLIRSTSHSIGDAMRDLDKRAILSGDFLVVYGDVVCNMPMDSILAEHRTRRAIDKNAIMTVVLREAGTQHRTKANDMLPTFVVDPAKKRCLHYEQIAPGSSQRHVQIDPDLLAQDIEVRTDLIDCGIDICTPDVLALWSDNFDYEAPRRGFLHSVLKDYELNGKTIHTHVVDDHYAARVRNLQAYDSISKDVMSRWSYPLCPDANLGPDSTYQFSKGNIFQEDGVKVARSSKIGPNAVVGASTNIGAGCNISDSVLGRGCSIGKNCQIRGAYIWDGVAIGDNTEVRRAILASEASTGNNCRITDGALISYGIHLPNGTVLVKRQRLTRKRKRGRDTAYDVSQEDDAEGYDVLSSDSEDESASNGLVGSMRSLRLSASHESISTLNSDTSSLEPPPNHRDSMVSVGSDDSHANPAAESFVGEAAGSIYDSLKQSQDPSTIQLELQGLRMAANASEHHVRRAVVGGLMRYVCEAHKSGKQVKDILADNKTLVERTVFDAGAEQKVDQVDFLLLTQSDMVNCPQGEGVFQAVCNGLYLIEDEGLFDEDAFQQWWDDARSQGSADLKRIRTKMQQFMEVIANDDEDEDDDDEDEDEEDASGESE